MPEVVFAPVFMARVSRERTCGLVEGAVAETERSLPTLDAVCYNAVCPCLATRVVQGLETQRVTIGNGATRSLVAAPTAQDLIPVVRIVERTNSPTTKPFPITMDAHVNAEVKNYTGFRQGCSLHARVAEAKGGDSLNVVG